MYWVVCNHNLATKLATTTKTRSHLGRKFAPTDLAKKVRHAIAIDLLLFPGGTFPIIKVLLKKKKRSAHAL